MAEPLHHSASSNNGKARSDFDRGGTEKKAFSQRGFTLADSGAGALQNSPPSTLDLASDVPQDVPIYDCAKNSRLGS